MQTQERLIDATTDDGDMAVLVTQPAFTLPAVTQPAGEADWPVVLLFIDAPGIRDATHAFAEKLAGEGYIVVTPDLHHRHGRLLNAVDTTPPEGSTTQQMVWGWISSMTDEQIQLDADCALAAAGIATDAPIVTIGFCLGARAVYRRLMADERALAGAAWHPSFLADDGSDSPHLTAAELTKPLYLAIGDADQVQSIEMHQPFLDAVAPLDHVTVEIFEGADHGFTWPGAPNYHEAAATGAWKATTALFADTFA